MSLSLQELRKRGPRVGTFVRKFYDEENFTFTDGSKEKISEVIFGTDKYNLKSLPSELLEAMGSRSERDHHNALSQPERGFSAKVLCAGGKERGEEGRQERRRGQAEGR